MPNNARDPPHLQGPPSLDEVSKGARENPGNMEAIKEEVSNLTYPTTMNEKMVHRFFTQTHNASVCQLPPSTLQMVQGENFIKYAGPKENFDLRWNS